MRINTKQTRVFAIEGTDGDGGNFITASLSSELPYQRDFGMETLLHGSCEFSNGSSDFLEGRIFQLLI